MYEKKVEITFVQGLNFFLANKRRNKTFEVTVKGKSSVKDLIESLNIPHCEVDVIVANGECVDFEYIINNDDSIQVYPDFAQCDIKSPLCLRPRYESEPKFVIDVNLGKLARYLRMCGFDVLYRNDLEDDEIADISVAENRIVLTRDIGVLKTGRVAYGYFVRSDQPEEQIIEVMKYFKFKDYLKLFSRCLECNELLQHVDKQKIESLLPDKVKESISEYKYCSICNKPFWKGSHYDAMLNFIYDIDSAC